MLKIKEGITTHTEAFLYGKYVFETFLVDLDGKVFQLSAHIQRMLETFLFLFPRISVKNHDIEESILDHIQNKKIIDKILRVNLFVDDEEAVLSFTDRVNTYTSIIIKQGFSIMISDVRKSCSSNILKYKTANYLENLLELEKARKNKFNDTLFLNDFMHISETCTANIFFIKNNKIFTPSVDSGILPGIIRAFIVKNIEGVEQDRYTLNELLNADEVFLTNSAFGIMPVARINSKTFSCQKTAEKLSAFLNDKK